MTKNANDFDLTATRIGNGQYAVGIPNEPGTYQVTVPMPSSETVTDYIAKAVERGGEAVASVAVAMERDLRKATEKPRYSTGEEPRHGDRVRHNYSGDERTIGGVTCDGRLLMGFVGMDPAEYSLVRRGDPSAHPSAKAPIDFSRVGTVRGMDNMALAAGSHVVRYASGEEPLVGDVIRGNHMTDLVACVTKLNGATLAGEIVEADLDSYLGSAPRIKPELWNLIRRAADPRPVLGQDRNGKDVRKGDRIRGIYSGRVYTVESVDAEGHFRATDGWYAPPPLAELVTDSTMTAAERNKVLDAAFPSFKLHGTITLPKANSQPDVARRAPPPEPPTLAAFTERVTAKVREMAPLATVVCDRGVDKGYQPVPVFFAQIRCGEISGGIEWPESEPLDGIDSVTSGCTLDAVVHVEMSNILEKLGARVMGKR